MLSGRDIEQLIAIMAALRHPQTGCPWDIEQTFATIAPYTIEEAYEVAEAIARDHPDDIKDELGDLLLQVVYHARMAEEAGWFAFPDVVEAITTKMVRRHPHVFGDDAARSAGAAKGFWESIKAQEKRERADTDNGEPAAESLLGDVPAGLPSVVRAQKLQSKAAKVGFDWSDWRRVVDKIGEEIRELSDELEAPTPAGERVADEVGDLMFAVVNLARHVGVDADQSLRRANAKFVRRFSAVESHYQGSADVMRAAGLEALEARWQEAKRQEKTEKTDS